MKSSSGLTRLEAAFVVILIGVVIVAGIGVMRRGPASSPTPSQTSSPTPEPEVQEFKMQNVKFTVKAPPNTPEKIYIRFFNALGYDEQFVELTKVNGYYVGNASLIEGSLLSYVFQIQPGLKERPWYRDTEDPNIRYVFVAPALGEVKETIIGWSKQSFSPPQGVLKVIVLDSSTKEPVFDATVSVAGLHVGTNARGEAIFDLPVGYHGITVHTILGEYKYEQREVLIEANKEKEVKIFLKPAKKVLVEFEVTSPKDMPDSGVRIVGNHYRLGMFFGGYSFDFYLSRAPVLDEKDGKLVKKLEFYKGTYLEYAYTVGTIGNGIENVNGKAKVRKVIVKEGLKIKDEISSFRTDQIEILFKATPPPDHNFKEVVYLQPSPSTGSDIGPMIKMPDGTYRTVRYEKPGKEYLYIYAHGIPGEGGEIIDPQIDEYRKLIVPNQDIVVEDKIEKWMYWERYETKTEVNRNLEITQRPEMIIGQFTFDRWSPDFLANFEGVLEDLKAHNEEWVGITQITDLVQIDPKPKFARWHAPWEDIRQAARMAHEKGLKIFVLGIVGVSGEISDIMEEKFETGNFTDEWWEAYYEELKFLHEALAKVAEEEKIEMINVPSVSNYMWTRHCHVVDKKLNEIVDQTRKIYSGYLYAPVQFTECITHFSKLDFLDPGISAETLGLDDDASIQEIKEKFDELIQQKAKPVYEKYKVPLILWFTYNSIDGAINGKHASEPYLSVKTNYTVDMEEHEKLLNAFIQAIAPYEFIQGILGRDYPFFELPGEPGPYFRDKPAEDILGEYALMFKQHIKEFKEETTPLEEVAPPEEIVSPENQTSGPPKLSVNFTVHVPANTPSNATIYLVFISFADGSEIRRIPMKAKDDTWSAQVNDLLEGSLLRYAYELGYKDQGEWEVTRESFDENIKINFRYLLVSPSTRFVEDWVACWRDISSSPLTGTVIGTVRDNKTGIPLIDATVSIAGVHLGTDHEGKFVLEGVPVGKQRVTVVTTLGDYKPFSKVVEVKPGETAIINFGLEPARRVNVTFNVIVPERTPKNAIVKISGNVYQLGSICWLLNNLAPDPARWVNMERISENKFTATVELYEGTYVEYIYTLGLNQERSLTGEAVIRSFVVGSSDEIRDDKIETWSVGGEVMLTLNVKVPANTPPNEPIFIDVGGPILPMDKISDNRWTFTYFTGPGTWNYKYVRGLVGMGHERLDGLQEFRTVVISESDLVVEDEVQAWRWYPEGDYPPPYEFQVVEIKPRDLFINGIFLSDFWWPSITPLISASLDRLDDINADWVALAHGWGWEKAEPVPKLSTRSVRVFVSSMPAEELKAVVQELQSRGKKVYLSLLMDESPIAGMSFWAPHSEEWYDQWYQEARRFYLYHAKLAEDLGVDALQLHGVQLFQYDDPDLRKKVDDYMRSIIQEMRNLFSGYLIVDGPTTGYTHYELVDFIGVSVWKDLGVSEDASVEELKMAFDSYFDNEVKWMYEEFKKPIVITQFAYPSINNGANQAPYISAFFEDDASVVLDLEEQARIYEAVFRSIAEREWIVGFLPFGYSYITLPESKDETIRGKPAEIVLSGYYQAFRDLKATKNNKGYAVCFTRPNLLARTLHSSNMLVAIGRLSKYLSIS